MSEVEVNGTNGGLDLDFTETKAGLVSSSTTLRIGLLHILEDRLAKNGKQFLRQALSIRDSLILLSRDLK